MGQLFGTMRGGLAISVVIVGALLAASTGVVGATVVTMGLISLPAMMRAGYDPKLATGVICASGTLGQIIPPSVILIFVGDLLMGANQLAAQNRQGARSGLGRRPVRRRVPAGHVLVGLYILYIVVLAFVRPKDCPALVMDEAQRASLGRRFVRALIPPLLLIVAVLGSILMGFATPTEAASIGAVGAMVLAAFNRAFSFGTLLAVMRNTAVISALVFAIVLGVSVFSLVFRGLGGEHLVEQILADVPGGAFGAVMAVMIVMFVLGFFMDTIEIVLIVVPITAPVIIAMGVNPVWLGVMIGVNLQTAFLTPPVGFALFYMRAVAPVSITTGDDLQGHHPVRDPAGDGDRHPVGRAGTRDLAAQAGLPGCRARRRSRRQPARLGARRHPQGAADRLRRRRSGSALDQLLNQPATNARHGQRSHPRPAAGQSAKPAMTRSARKGPALPPALAGRETVGTVR